MRAPLAGRAGLMPSDGERSRVAGVDADAFRHVLGHLPTGVAIITAYGAEAPVGVACNSLTGLSLAPPLILFCPARSSASWPEIRAAGGFCVNVLAHDQEALSLRFAERGVDRFEGVPSSDRSHGPGIEGAVAWVDCEIAAEHDGGDHMIVVGAVRGLEARDDVAPLVFFRGGYGTFADGFPAA